MSNNESVADDKISPPGTSASQSAGPQIEIVSDEDWKNQVKEQDAALDQQFRSQPAGSESAGSQRGGESQSPRTTAQAAQTTDSVAAQSAEQGRRAETQTAREMPEPTFADLVGLLSTQAMMFLGLIPNPATQKPETQLSTARYFIDMLSILEDKTAGQLTKEESYILDDALHSLRMTYMQRSKQIA
jgi:hypothetical protein